MTPEEISKLSDQELNELIAKKSGMYIEHSIKYECPVYEFNGGIWTRCPDFCSSWQLSGELLEAINENEKAWLSKLHEKWQVWFTERDVFVIADSPTRAISEAWYLMECEK